MESDNSTVASEISDSEEEDLNSETGDINSDINASETESDEDESMDDDDTDEEHPKSKKTDIKEKILNKYNLLKGKQMYVRFMKKLPLDQAEFERTVKALSPLITHAHKPRQKHARFCLVDFNSQEDRDKVLQEIKQLAKQENETYKGIFVSTPKTESDEFLSDLVERKEKSIENRKAKAGIKRAKKQALRNKKFTSSVVAKNLPKTTSIVQLRTLFPTAVDIQFKANKGNDTNIATITLPSTMDARQAVKRKLSIDGTNLLLRYNTQQIKKHIKKNLKSNKKSIKNNAIVKTPKLK